MIAVCIVTECVVCACVCVCLLTLAYYSRKPNNPTSAKCRVIDKKGKTGLARVWVGGQGSRLRALINDGQHLVAVGLSRLRKGEVERDEDFGGREAPKRRALCCGAIREGGREGGLEEDAGG